MDYIEIVAIIWLENLLPLHIYVYIPFLYLLSNNKIFVIRNSTYKSTMQSEMIFTFKDLKEHKNQYYTLLIYNGFQKINYFLLNFLNNAVAKTFFIKRTSSC